jgi:hypothetical protein
VLKSNKKKQFGFDAVNARICKGTLRILEGACPNLLIEAGKYRYNPDAPKNRAEEPIDEYNHALCALRYPIATLDQRSILGRLANVFRSGSGDDKGNPPQGPGKPKRDAWLRLDNEALWTQIYP